ncbi:MAG: O-antigen ligase [Candidatus Cloacimonetes bacterium]|nr:O-antigen ligase [Candidatus Cloacimonadota bacterium]
MIFIPFTIYFIILLYIIKKKSYYIGSFLILIYMATYGCNIISYYSKFIYPASDFTFEAMLYLTVFTLLPIMPFVNICKNNIDVIYIEDVKIYKIISTILIIVGLYCIFYFIPYVLKVFSGNINDYRILVNADRSDFVKNGIFNVIAMVGINFFTPTIATFFIEFIRGNRIRSILLLIASLSYVIGIAAHAGRDGFVIWFFNFTFFLILFKPFINKTQLRKIYNIMIIIGVIFVVPFIIITASRFSTSNNILKPIIAYTGQNVIYFNDFYNADLKIYKHGAGIFPYFYSGILRLRGENTNIIDYIKKDQINYLLSMGSKAWTFGTYLKSLISDFGKIGTIIFTLLLTMINRKEKNIAQKNRGFTYSNILIIGFIAHIISSGVFYYLAGYISSNIYIIMFAIMILYIKYANRYNIRNNINTSRVLTKLRIKN